MFRFFNRWIVYSRASSIGSPQMYLHVYNLHSPGEKVVVGTTFFSFFLLLMFLGRKQRCEFKGTLFIPASQGKEDSSVFVNVI